MGPHFQPEFANCGRCDSATTIQPGNGINRPTLGRQLVAGTVLRLVATELRNMRLVATEINDQHWAGSLWQVLRAKHKVVNQQDYEVSASEPAMTMPAITVPATQKVCSSVYCQQVLCPQRRKYAAACIASNYCARNAENMQQRVLLAIIVPATQKICSSMYCQQLLCLHRRKYAAACIASTELATCNR